MSHRDIFLIALGANLPSDTGPPEVTLTAALDRLRRDAVCVMLCSRFFKTPCFPPGAGPDYVNAAARIGFEGTAVQLLGVLHGVEAAFGRKRVQRWGQRTLDIDLIAQGDMVLPDMATHREWRDLPPDRRAMVAPEDLILPHPRMQERAFVLVPLADVAPDWRHPVLGLSVAEMVAGLPRHEVAAVVPVIDPSGNGR